MLLLKPSMSNEFYSADAASQAFAAFAVQVLHPRSSEGRRPARNAGLCYQGFLRSFLWSKTISDRLRYFCSLWASLTKRLTRFSTPLSMVLSALLRSMVSVS
jgi:hypothetical protein